MLSDKDFVRIWLGKFQALDTYSIYYDSMLKMHSLISKKHTQLVLDIVHIARKKVKQRGKRLPDLRFAKRTADGYAFFKAKYDIWDILHEIAQEVFAKHSQYDFSFIVEVCSEVVNSDESDIISLDLAA